MGSARGRYSVRRVRPDAPPLRLSPRQHEVLGLLFTGRSEKEMARDLGLSHHTVHIYVKAVYRRFGVHSRSELHAVIRERHRTRPPGTDTAPVGDWLDVANAYPKLLKSRKVRRSLGLH